MTPETPARLHALIVEDELLIGIGVQTLLRDLGFASFSFAGTAAQAEEQGRLRRPDLLTVDMQLLDGEGDEAATRVRAACGSVPTVFITGSPERVRAAWAVVVEKPVTPGALARAVKMARSASAA